MKSPQRPLAAVVSLSARYSSPTSPSLKLRRWRKKLSILLQANALNMLGRRLAFSTAQNWNKSESALRSPGLVLAYHRVAGLTADPQMLAVKPTNFDEQLIVLREHFKVISLREMIWRLKSKQSVSGCVSLTFDDGYADNLFSAKPLLERHSTPATIFIASNHIGASTEFWWDELERLLLQPGTLPRNLHLRISGRDYAWDLGDDAHCSESDYERNSSWNVTRPDSISRRHQIYRALHGLLGLLNSEQRDQGLASLRAWANKAPIGRPTHRTVTAPEVIELAAGDLIEIGAHTATHPVLSMLTEKEQEIEIRRSKQRLTEILGKPITSFAFPYGSLSDYGGETVSLVKSMGFDCACSTFADAVRPGCDHFQLPRFMVRDWNGEEFLRRLRMWMQR